MSQSFTRSLSFDAYMILESDKTASLVDVRTTLEQKKLGMPDLKRIQKQLISIPLTNEEKTEINPHFISTLEDKIPNKSHAVFFICHSGQRSGTACSLVYERGYKNSYNISDGFCGESNNGWKFIGLPWELRG